MKLYITNKKEFEQYFDCPNMENFSSSEIHKFAYQKLLKSVSTENSIPIILLQNIDLDGWKDAEFRFSGFKNDIYFYEFHGVIS